MKNFKHITVEVKGHSAWVNGKRYPGRMDPFQESRPKIFYNEYVIKIDEDNSRDIYDDFTQNQTEIQRWNHEFEAKDKKYFAGIEGYKLENNGLFWIAQKRVEFKVGRPSNKAREIIAYLVDKYQLDDVEYREFKVNWGIRKNGDPVIYDWGF